MGSDFNTFLEDNLPSTVPVTPYAISEVVPGLKQAVVNFTLPTEGQVMIGESFQSFTPATPPPYVAVNAREELINGTLKKGEKSIQCSSCGDWVPESKATKVKGRVLCTTNKCALEVRRV